MILCVLENQRFIYLQDTKLEISRQLLTEQQTYRSDVRFHSVINTTANIN